MSYKKTAKAPTKKKVLEFRYSVVIEDGKKLMYQMTHN